MRSDCPSGPRSTDFFVIGPALEPPHVKVAENEVCADTTSAVQPKTPKQVNTIASFTDHLFRGCLPSESVRTIAPRAGKLQGLQPTAAKMHFATRTICLPGRRFAGWHPHSIINYQ